MRNLQKSKWRYGLLLLASVAVLNVGCSMNKKQDETETELAEGQRRAAIELVSITGNEITYYEVEEETEAETEGTSETAEEAGSEDAAEASSETAEPATEAGTEAAKPAAEAGSEAEEPVTEAVSETIISETAADKTQQASGRMGRGQRGQMPDGGDGTIPTFSQTSDGEMPDMSEMAEKFMSGVSQVETVTAYLPVGVTVYTDTGKKTTFSVLQAGDELDVLFETNENGDEIITEIRITGAE